jgi:hypothetical protein
MKGKIADRDSIAAAFALAEPGGARALQRSPSQRLRLTLSRPNIRDMALV